MFKVAAIQMKVLPGKVKENRKKATRMVKQAAAAGAELVVLPEFWLSGYHLTSEEFRPLGETPYGETVTRFRELARNLQIIMVVPFLENRDGDLYVSAAVIERSGELLGIYRKTYLWGKESDTFVPGEKYYPVFDTSLGKLGVLICYDAEFPEPARLLALQGAQLVVVPSVWSLEAEPRWDIQLPARALDNTVFVLGTNTTGNGSCGKSKLVAPDGRVLKQVEREEEAILIHDVDFKLLTTTRERIPYLQDYDTMLTPGGNEYYHPYELQENRRA
ncbi:MAG: nitrilase [Bacillaceae bacterium]|nr:nitrilase [Bacillaceae bacterium]